MYDIAGLKNALPDALSVLPGMQKKTADEWGGPCPKCGGTDRFQLWPASGKFWCRQCGWKGDAIDFFRWKDNTDLLGLRAKYGPFNGELIPKQTPKQKSGENKPEKARTIEENIVAYFPYHDETGNILSYAVRFEEKGREKTFRQWQKGMSGEWIHDIKGVRRVLYNLPAVAKADSVVFVEGEKCAEICKSIGQTATTSPMGAGNWKSEYAESLQGKNVFIFPDNDEVGRKHVSQVAESLHGIAKSVKIIQLPGLPEKGDIHDFISTFKDTEEAKERLAIMINGTEEWRPCEEKSEGSTAENKSLSRFKLVHVGELVVKAAVFLIKGLLEADSLALVFGDPGTFKSFLAIAWACCVATSTAFVGRAVKPGPVVYIAGEGQNGLARRFNAWAIRNRVSLRDAPLFVSTMPAGLCDSEQTKFVVDAIDDITATHGPPVLIVIDTVARNFGPGDENSTKDMSGFIQSCDAIRAKYQATVLLVHHSGHGDKTRARGAMALKGALDAEYRTDIDESGVIRLEATKMKDAEFPAPMAFRSAVVELGINDDEGNPVTSAVLDETAYEPPAKTGREGRGKWQTVAVEVLENLHHERQRNLLNGGYDPDTARITVDDWRAACFEKGMNREAWRTIKNKPPAGITIQNGFVSLD